MSSLHRRTGGGLGSRAGAGSAPGSRGASGACLASLLRDLRLVAVPRVRNDVAVYLGTLDDPVAIEPRIHQCIDEQVAWLRLNDLLPFVEGAALIPPAERVYLRGAADPSVTRSSSISLRAITAETLKPVLFADVAGNQRRFVAHNAISVAQALSAGDVWTARSAPGTRWSVSSWRRC